MFSCFILEKCSVNRPQGDRMAEDDRWAKKSIWNVVYYRWDVYDTILWYILVLRLYIVSEFYILV